MISKSAPTNGHRHFDLPSSLALDPRAFRRISPLRRNFNSTMPPYTQSSVATDNLVHADAYSVGYLLRTLRAVRYIVPLRRSEENLRLFCSSRCLFGNFRLRRCERFLTNVFDRKEKWHTSLRKKEGKLRSVCGVTQE